MEYKNKRFLIIWGIVIVIYSILFSDVLELNELIMGSVMITALIISLLEVVFKRKDQSIYPFSEKTNNFLRYASFVFTAVIVPWFHYNKFCLSLKMCG
jgi:hypothetical protein